MIERKPARLLLAAGLVKADKRSIRTATRKIQDRYDRAGLDTWMLLVTGRRIDGDGPEAA